MLPSVNIRMSTETKLKGEQQASKLGLNLSEYIRLIIELDSATGLLGLLKSKVNYEKAWNTLEKYYETNLNNPYSEHGIEIIIKGILGQMKIIKQECEETTVKE